MNLRKVSDFPYEGSIAISASLIIILVQLLLKLLNLDLLLVALLSKTNNLLVQLSIGRVLEIVDS